MTRDRVAGLMVLLYGQIPPRICRLTTAHVHHDDHGVALRVNKTPLRLPPSLDDLVLQLVDIARNDEHMVTSNELNAPWLFPTQRPGKPLSSSRLAARLHNIGLRPKPDDVPPCSTSASDAPSCPSAAPWHQPVRCRALGRRRCQSRLCRRGGPPIMTSPLPNLDSPLG